MGIEAKIDMREIRDILNRESQKHIHRVIALLQNVGETTVNEIRASHISNWNDQSGNLRSSTGYIITMDGKPIQMGKFEKVVGPKPDPDEPDGTQEGRNYAMQLASLYPNGIALIVVAGMEYASYVEKRDNKTVLAQGEIEARRLVDQMIRELNSKTKAGE